MDGNPTGPQKPATAADGGYRVLARKYRPDNFDALIGQEPMVRTLRNGFAAGRIAQAWMLTGVRGVGKTTTARILARGLNHETEDGTGEPTVDLADDGVHCKAIMEGRHPDVIEIDAASHTGIDDVREIIDSARYSPVSARYKVYIVDEVHMLSKQAFNGLLKTLEEPPAHVKFIFATTEIRRVPVTVLSRCQRFDLKRVDTAVLEPYLRRIVDAEEVGVDDSALSVIARAAEGSVRDALSILDQAIAHGSNTGNAIDADTVQDMLGLADKSRIIALFEAVAGGRTADALALLQSLYDAGADPAVVLTELAGFVHYVTRLKVVSDSAAADPAASEAERVRGAEFAEKLSLRVLSRLWQMLISGVNEVSQARMPLAAADMVLVRLCHVADLPTPDEALKMLAGKDGDEAKPASPSVDPSPGAGPGRADSRESIPASPIPAPPAAVQSPESGGGPPAPAGFDDLIALAREKRDRLLAFALERHVFKVDYPIPRPLTPG